VVCNESFNDCGCKTIVLSGPFFIHIGGLAEIGRIKGTVSLMCSMSVHCIIQNNKHQLMHQNI
jgi:hypothetical protein